MCQQKEKGGKRCVSDARERIKNLSKLIEEQETERSELSALPKEERTADQKKRISALKKDITEISRDLEGAKPALVGDDITYQDFYLLPP